MRKEETAP